MRTAMMSRAGVLRGPMTRLAAALGVISLTSFALATAGPVASRADTPGFSNGTAAATAQGFRINPTAAQLSVGITFGLTLAGYTNQVAKGDARGIDLGVIGTTLAAAGCDGGKPTWPQDQQPNPLTVDSRDAGSAQGKTEPETANQSPLPGITKFARATPEPYGEARVDYSSLSASGVIDIAGTRTDSVVHVVNNNTREAIATSDIGLLSIAGGAVKLSNLHWQAVHHSGADTKPATTFSIGSASVGGQPISVQDPTAAFASINQALSGIGIELRPPKPHVDAGLVTIPPLAVAVVPNSTRDQISGNVLGAAQPARQAITDALLKASCHFGDVLTVLDIAVGSITGSGSFSLELGGVQAGSGVLNLANALDFNAGQSAPEAGGLSSTPGAAAAGDLGGPAGALPSVGSSGGGAGTTGGSGGSASVAGHQFASPIASHAGTRGGMLAAVGGAGLLLLLAAVEGDRRMMRRAQRMIP